MKLTMTTSTVSKNLIREKIGKKSWLDNQQTLADKLDYVSGIDTFDEILNGKTMREFGAVIHLEKFPKGLLFSIATGLGFKTYPFPIGLNEIRNVSLLESSDNNSQIIFELEAGNKIIFRIKRTNIWDVKDFLKEINLNYEVNIINASETKTASTNEQENNQKHGVPTIISFFIPGVGQLIKGHTLKAVGIWLIGAIVGVSLWWTYFAPLVVWIWNIYDAYNSNSDWKL